MRSLNPLEGEFYREALQVSRSTREMFCLMEGRHVHPSTLYPGGVGTTPTVQLFTDYLTRLMRYVEFMKRVVPMHDDLFDFFYEALPGYEEVGRRRADMVCWGSLNDPEHCDFRYDHMTNWGRKMFVTPGVIRDGQLVTNDLVEINLGIRILLGSSFYEDWEDQEMFVTRDPLGNPVDRRHPWNQHTIPRPQKRDFDDKYSWVMSPRWFDGKNHLAADTGGGPLARLWATALGGLVDIGYVKSTGHSVQINLPRTVTKPEISFEWKIPVRQGRRPLSNAIERDRARTYFQAYAAAAALYFMEQALAEIRAGRTKTWEPFSVPDEANSCGFTEAVRGVLSHHMVIRDGKIANYHPYPPTPWNASVRDSYGTPGPYEDAVQNTPIFEENPPDRFKGIDIMRAVRSFDPCLPCGVHMYLGNGKTLEKVHSPMSRSVTSWSSRVARPGWPPERRPPEARRMTGVRSAGARVEELLDALRSGGSARAALAAEELVGLLVGLYGDGLAAIVELLAEQGPAGRRLLAALADDPRVEGLLLLHDLHPLDVDARIQRALDRVRPYLGSHAGGVQYLGVADGVARLRLEGSCDGCPSSTVTVELAIRGAVEDAAPEVTEVVVEGMAAAPEPGLLPDRPSPGRRRTGRRRRAAAGAGGWILLPDIGPPSSRPVSAAAGGTAVLVCSVRGTLYAYLDACAACGSSMADGKLDREELTCPACGARVQRAAGRQGHRRPGAAPGPAAAAGRQPGRPGRAARGGAVMTART